MLFSLSVVFSVRCHLGITQTVSPCSLRPELPVGLPLIWDQSDPVVDRSCGFVEDIPEVLLQGETAGRLLLCGWPLDGARSLDGSC